MYFLAAFVLVCVDVMVMSSAYAMTCTGAPSMDIKLTTRANKICHVIGSLGLGRPKMALTTVTDVVRIVI